MVASLLVFFLMMTCWATCCIPKGKRPTKQEGPQIPKSSSSNFSLLPTSSDSSDLEERNSLISPQGRIDYWVVAPQD